jgi:hypothetical protein
MFSIQYKEYKILKRKAIPDFEGKIKKRIFKIKFPAKRTSLIFEN